MTLHHLKTLWLVRLFATTPVISVLIMGMLALPGQAPAQAAETPESPSYNSPRSRVQHGQRPPLDSLSEIPVATGAATRTWLTKQAQHEDASPHQQTLSGPAMKRTYQRYLKSFETPVPERFEGGSPLTSR